MSGPVVASIHGPIVVLRHPPEIGLARFDRLHTPAGVGASVALCGRERSWAITDEDDEALAPGQVLERGEPALVGLEPERLISVGLTLAEDAGSSVCETGIKIVDVLLPIVEGGVTWILGGAYLGRMDLLAELRLRLERRRARQTLIFPLLPSSAASLAGSLAARPGFPPDEGEGARTLWLISEHVDHHALAELDPIGHTRIFCGPNMPARGYWPAIDPLASRSRALAAGVVESAHVRLVGELLSTLAWAEQVRADPTFDALAARRAFRAATLRTLELAVELHDRLDGEARVRLAIAERLEHYFAQPLHTSAEQSGRPGTHVPAPEALVACRELLAGREPEGGYDYPARGGS
jgi:hypothetical protein